jgi:hypothetical protein
MLLEFSILNPVNIVCPLAAGRLESGDGSGRGSPRFS